MITNARKSFDPISRADIELSDKEILARYAGITKVPCVLRSPFRNDSRPSFSIYERDGVIRWKDFGTGECGGIIMFLAKLWNETTPEVLRTLQADKLTKRPQRKLERIFKEVRPTGHCEFRVKIREWNDADMKYWNAYGIGFQMLRWSNVYPISHIIFRNSEMPSKDPLVIRAEKYAYAYFEWKDGKQSCKIYQPFSKSMKWMSSHDSSVWDLWKQAMNGDRGDSVIITSSRKDAMCLWSVLGVPAMALQGEGYMPKPQVMQQILDRFPKVYLWYDNDQKHAESNPGQENAKKMLSMYPTLINVCLPAELKSKDPSDLVKNSGQEALQAFWLIQTSKK